MCCDHRHAADSVLVNMLLLDTLHSCKHGTRRGLAYKAGDVDDGHFGRWPDLLAVERSNLSRRPAGRMSPKVHPETFMSIRDHESIFTRT
jgi:hypothetical protein